MMDIIGHRFDEFRDLAIRGFLAVRQQTDSLMAIFELMLGSDLPCFKRGAESLHEMRKRFVPDASEIEAAKHFKGIVDNAVENTRTTLYDKIQKMKEDIDT